LPFAASCACWHELFCCASEILSQHAWRSAHVAPDEPLLLLELDEDDEEPEKHAGLGQFADCVQVFSFCEHEVHVASGLPHFVRHPVSLHAHFA
jgi:hypothetical protein